MFDGKAPQLFELAEQVFHGVALPLQLPPNLERPTTNCGHNHSQAPLGHGKLFKTVWGHPVHQFV